MGPESKFDEADKLHWEVRKLQAECRPWFRGPAGVTALVAILGIGIQWFRSDAEYKSAQIKADMAKLESQKAANERDLAVKLRDEYTASVEALKKTLAEMEGQRTALAAEIEGFKQRISKAIRPEEVAALKNDFVALQARQAAVSQHFKEQTNKLPIMSRSIGDRTTGNRSANE